ncbi:hypothetical protein [Halovulum sp. GXIMD14793]
MRSAAAIVFLALAACEPGPSSGSAARDASADALRACATVTQHCPGVAALLPTMPRNCRAAPQAGCLMTIASGREILGAVDMPDGTVCGYQRTQAGGRVAAILGRIGRSRDGTVQYVSARFPRDGQALPRLTSVGQLIEECATLS